MTIISAPPLTFTEYKIVHEGWLSRTRYYPINGETVVVWWWDEDKRNDLDQARQAAEDKKVREQQRLEFLEAEDANRRERILAQQNDRDRQLRQETAAATTEQLLAALYRRSPDMAAHFLANRTSIQELRAQAVTVIAEMMAKVADYDKAIADLNALIPAPVDKPKRNRKTA